MSSATEQSTERPDTAADVDGPIKEIGHDEYDPIGTLVLIGLYFLILVALWFFMYFVEFVGNDPTVVSSILMGVGLV
ncbi:hypothetical protein SAMN05444422_11362 [Halobiforma haloterrestris]|uniref:Cytochrome c oxidase subunit IIa family protein n=1 Tax=Natronobacterium haloterrestre TaxID=148448 RepID=A0A1I1KXS3_NATHA|nr:hypothetical protein [Halobiforma haloterrestris]SFC65609.1 hypothetical protein SAMN05444422_11362 [Halobiforma haloterrestris]